MARAGEGLAALRRADKLLIKKDVLGKGVSATEACTLSLRALQHRHMEHLSWRRGATP